MKQLYTVAGAVVFGFILNGCDAPATVSDVKEIVRNQLRDPESARFSEVRLVKRSFTHQSPVTGKDVETDVSTVCGLVNSKNGFGGYAGDSPLFSVVSVETGSQKVRLKPPKVLILDDDAPADARVAFSENCLGQQ